MRQPILILGQKCGTTFRLRYPELFQDGPMNLAKTQNYVTGWRRCRLELFNDKFKLNLKILTNKIVLVKYFYRSCSYGLRDKKV